MIDVWGEVIKISEVAAPVLLGIWVMRRKEKNKWKHVTSRISKSSMSFLIERKYLVPHDHNEDEGPLTFDGIVRRKFNGNRLDELASYFRPRAEALIAEASAAGIDVVIIDTGRTRKNKQRKFVPAYRGLRSRSTSLNTLSLRAKLSTYAR